MNCWTVERPSDVTHVGDKIEISTVITLHLNMLQKASKSLIEFTLLRKLGRRFYSLHWKNLLKPDSKIFASLIDLMSTFIFVLSTSNKKLIFVSRIDGRSFIKIVLKPLSEFDCVKLSVLLVGGKNHSRGSMRLNVLASMPRTMIKHWLRLEPKLIKNDSSHSIYIGKKCFDDNDDNILFCTKFFSYPDNSLDLWTFANIIQTEDQCVVRVCMFFFRRIKTFLNKYPNIQSRRKISNLKKVGKWVPLCCTLGGGVNLGLGITYGELCITFSIWMPGVVDQHFVRNDLISHFKYLVSELEYVCDIFPIYLVVVMDYLLRSYTLRSQCTTLNMALILINMCCILLFVCAKLGYAFCTAAALVNVMRRMN
ncbi:hypothetical protein AGLY_006355 [Aphis glycines]|uniref:Uncharacterized protein n=1 Tax=Aphis glycines TaxID=307491 RepID=A0A6G0TRD5_APHGL|nr:hypothetical protein AGLY_006355 [Aphis glycines]